MFIHWGKEFLVPTSRWILRGSDISTHARVWLGPAGVLCQALYIYTEARNLVGRNIIIIITLDFLSKNKCIHTYYLRTLQHRLGLNVPLRNGKLSGECSEIPHHLEPPSLTLWKMKQVTAHSRLHLGILPHLYSTLKWAYLWPLIDPVHERLASCTNAH